MAKSFAVIGLGRFGSNIARALAEKGFEVIVIDSDENEVRELSDIVSGSFVLDATDDKSLLDAGIADVDVAIVSVGQKIDDSILITLILKEMGIKEVIVKAVNERHGKILQRIGADRVIYPEREVALRLAESFVSPKIVDYIALSPTHSIIEIEIPAKFIGKTLHELDLLNKYHVSLIAIKRKIPIVTDKGTPDFKEEIIISPSTDEELQEGDKITLLGKNDDLEKIERL
ncbi:MAG: TrkA family potassium uptake protein [candidate division WOR-3 bacterium]|nr:TrkA family potassium uptake protein [candidate division WOR-3 bacterium]MCX7757095.1 TrkA family potassium uptake protein [candidate division WOR-3 bacterium]MDW7988223.1 TrkA family potassium uptake protein [candidate division WOR-3 bacterium]